MSRVTLPVGSLTGPRHVFRVLEEQVWPLPPGSWWQNPHGYAVYYPTDPQAAGEFFEIPLTHVDRLEPVGVCPYDTPCDAVTEDCL